MGPTENMPRIPEELSGKDIFVTGGSGFMGKVLLEKLLRSCPDVGCIYLLMRPKRGVSVAERLRAILDVPLFEPLLSEHPEVASKLRVVSGDCSEIRLGLSAEDEDVLVRNVSYVFHVAATVRFDDPLHDAIILNTRSTREVVELSKKMTKLRVLEYVSTTYTFTNEPILEERHYAAHLDWKTMIKLAETADQYSLFAITKKLLGFQPNTYTLTKALAENIINDARHDIPVIIFRPAVVISSVKEPFAGWLDNFNGPFGIWAGVTKGVLRYLHADNDVALSFTPVDWAIRGMITCAVARATSPQVVRPDPQHLAVVNMCVDFVRSTYRDQVKLLSDYIEQAVYPIRYPAFVLNKCYPYFWLGTVLTQLPYGVALDILLRLIGQKPRMMSTYRKIFQANEALSHFLMNEFPIATGKMYEVDKTIHPDDRLLFEITMEVNDDLKHQYNIDALKGAFKYVLNETTTVEETRSRLKKLYALEIVLNVLVAFAVYITFGRFFMTKISHVAPIFKILS